MGPCLIFGRSISVVPISALVMAVLCFADCSSKEEQQDRVIEETNLKAKALDAQLVALYEVYLEGDRQQAKRALEEMVLATDASKVAPRANAAALWLIYSRLYVLERRGGSATLADAYLLKARYWLLRKGELSGFSAEEAGEGVSKFTADKCLEMIDHWDKSRTNGKGPNYAQGN